MPSSQDPEVSVPWPGTWWPTFTGLFWQPQVLPTLTPSPSPAPCTGQTGGTTPRLKQQRWMGHCGRHWCRTTSSGPQVRGSRGRCGRGGAWTGMGQVDCGGFSRRRDGEWSWEQGGATPTQTQFFLPQPEAGGAGLHHALCLPQAWPWIITMNVYTGQMPNSQSSAVSGSMAQTPLWQLTANEVSI